jgi:hypothetical protein
LAIAARVPALLFAPLLLWRAPGKAWAVFTACLAVAYGPFFLHGASEGGGLKVFASEWEFNSFAFGLLQRVLAPEMARVICVLLFAAAYIWFWVRKRDARHADILLGLFFLLSPVVNAWYLVLLAPFVALNPSIWGVTALTTVLLSYATGMNTGHTDMGLFDHAWWVRPAELLPVLFAGLYDRFRDKAVSAKLNISREGVQEN